MEKKKKVFDIVEWILVFVLIGSFTCLLFYTRNRVREADNIPDMSASKLVLYEGPKSLKDATPEDLAANRESQRDNSLMHCTDTSIKVNGYDLYVYDTTVNNSRVWAADYQPKLSRTPITYFDFEGIAKLDITVPDIELETVKISPVESGIDSVIDKEAHKVSFTITQPGDYTVTFNDSPARALHIFTNPIETDAPARGDEKVVYVGPGEWNIESIILSDDETLYISGGAVIHGIVNANYAKNVTVMGRGIIDCSHLETWGGTSAQIPLKFDNCSSVKVSDIIQLNSNAWVFNSLNTTDEVIDNIRIISARPNGDGITLQSCNNITVQNCFVRSWDDSMVVKNYAGDTNNITFKDSQIWTDLAQSMEIGYETNKGKKENAVISKITFENITVLNNFHKPVISIHNADDATISDITYKNITVENLQSGSGDGDKMPYLIDLWVTLSPGWSKTLYRGQIRNVTIDGVNVLGGRDLNSRIQGYDEAHTIEGVTIRNLQMFGNKLTSLDKFEIDPVSTKGITIE